MRTSQQTREDSRNAVDHPRSRNPKRPSTYRGAVRHTWIKKEAERLHNKLYYRWTVTIQGNSYPQTGDFTTYQKWITKPNSLA